MQLFVDTICRDLLRFEHSVNLKVRPEQVNITQEVYLGIPGAFADMRVCAPGVDPYFVEVKYSYSRDNLLRAIIRKYGRSCQAQLPAAKLLLVIGPQLAHDWPEIESELKSQLYPGLVLEVWDHEILLGLLRRRFQVDVSHLGTDNAAEVRSAIDYAKGQYAFGTEFISDAVHELLLWHFSFLLLHEIRTKQQIDVREILRPGLYPGIIVVFADLSNFSSFVRHTPDEATVRYILTAFYSKTRYEVINRGGMLYDFLGDGVLALFGLFDTDSSYFHEALECAKALMQIGASVSNEWQRQIDRVENSAGCHIGMTLGEIQFLALRPYSRIHFSAIGDSINLAARLSAVAQTDEVVISNVLFQRLSAADQSQFQEMEAVDAKNIGRVRTWRLKLQR